MDGRQTSAPIAASAIPRRHRLTISNGQGKPSLRTGANEVPRTWVTILPLESHCVAARIGFANPFNQPMAILGASIVASDSYNPVNGALMAGTSNGIATGGAPVRRVYFDHLGMDSAEVKAHGGASSLVIPPRVLNASNQVEPFTINWSDWTPVSSIPRADGGGNPLLFIYVSLGAGSMSTACFGSDPFTYCNSHACRGRAIVNLKSDLAGDWAMNPTETPWSGLVKAPAGNGSQWAFSPVFCIQYLSVMPGVQIAISGDSLMCGPGGMDGDGFTAAPMRAAWDISTPSMPVCVAHLACGGAGSDVYHDVLLRNLPAIQPSVLILQPLSRNDGMASTVLDALLGKLLAAAQLAEVGYRARTVFQGAFPLPSVAPRGDGGSDELQLWQAMRARLTAMAASGMPVFDGASIIGDEAAPWLYQDGYSDDDAHPNDAATERLVPSVRRLLRQLIEQPAVVP